MDYHEYIKSEQWKEKKLEFRNGADGKRPRRCSICGKKKFTQVHHKTYRRLGNERREDLIEVCGSCHLEIHALEKQGIKLYRCSDHLRTWKRQQRKNRIKTHPYKKKVILRKKNPKKDWIKCLYFSE